MNKALQDYKTIYQDNAIQRKKRYQATQDWFNKDYTDIPNLQEVLTFCENNGAIMFVKQFYDKLIFPLICNPENEFDADALLMVFQNTMVGEYLQYLLWKVSVIELENIVLNKYPNNKDILEYRYTRQKQYFDYSIHEVSSGILYDNNGASIENLHEMKEDLTEFQKLSSFLNIENDEYIKYVFDLYNAYEQYLINRNDYLNFQNYLQINEMKY